MSKHISIFNVFAETAYNFNGDFVTMFSQVIPAGTTIRVTDGLITGTNVVHAWLFNGATLVFNSELSAAGQRFIRLKEPIEFVGPTTISATFSAGVVALVTVSIAANGTLYQ